jgi:nitroimidazol reductase NimA-like FMN-containing flavoprotein (pyridoxamine 5'-phosphate oxidase superfamily)
MNYMTQFEVRDLSFEEAEELLRRHAVGRLAYLMRNQVEIVPIHYVYADGWIYARSAVGQKLRALLQAPWVAFEVDEIENAGSWRSVVVRGSAQILDPEGPPMEREALEQAIAALRKANPNVLREGDPSPGRNFVVRIHADRVTGKAASPIE